MIITQIEIQGCAIGEAFQLEPKFLILGIGKGFCLILLLSSLKSEMNLTDPSFLEMMKAGAAHSE